MTGPRETVSSTYSYRRYSDDIDKTIAFREVSLNRDLGRLHSWLNEPHVLPYWTQDDPLPQVRDTIAERAANDDQTLYVGYLDHVPMSYWESYWAARDGLSAYYDARPTDQGIHLLIGPPEYLGYGYATPLLKSMVAFQFQHSETQRIVTEPDVQNEKAIHVFENCGFEPQREIAMDEKDALLMFCERERFESEVDV
ncbi:GNAT family N-acetyltransferase [Halorussus ruber]|uniref:GNAT family N-acetyltransferase n=1 Tax=Halorussus ruber TaxID=1126238 RepID=UPI0010926855|nr:GNAT family N-acetyltransferase [Halorussus ruber]